MPVSMQSLGIDRLPVEEQLALVHDIWDSIAAHAPPALSEAQRQELRRRVAEDDASPDDTVSSEEAVAGGCERGGRPV